MNFIAAMFLMHIQDEEDAFWCLVYVMFARDWRSIFVDNAKKIETLIFDLGKYLKKNNRPVLNHIEKDEVATLEACFSS